MSSANGIFLPPLGSSQGQEQGLHCFESLVENPGQELTGVAVTSKAVTSGVGVFGSCSVAFGGRIVSPGGKIPFKLCMFIH